MTETIQDAAREIARIRGRSCLVLSSPSLDPVAVRAVRLALADRSGEIDVVLRGPGGCACCAYAIARDLRRRFEWVGVLVPLPAKSAMTLIALAADEIVFGERGELGPLDAQLSEKQQGDFPVDRSCLEMTRALDHFKRYALETFNEVVTSVIEKSGMRAEDACRVGTELVGRLCQPLYAQIDPRALGASLRANDTGIAYAERLLRRYRPDLWAHNGAFIVERLANRYPEHGFVIDAEELVEMCITAREASADEAPAIARLASALKRLSEKDTFVELIDAGNADPETVALQEEPPPSVRVVDGNAVANGASRVAAREGTSRRNPATTHALKEVS